MKNIYLKEIDGFEFEKLCATLLSKEYYDVVRSPNTNDFGKDIIAYKDGKKYVIECKHYLNNGVIGRPVIQKLHSAMIHEDTNFGILITTGKIAKNALNYIDDLKNKHYFIETMDYTQLLHLAAQSNINLIFKEITIGIQKISPLSAETLTIKLIDVIKSVLVTRLQLNDSLNIIDYFASDEHAYKVDYSVESYHSTSAMNHLIKKEDSVFFNSEKNLLTETLSSKLIKEEYVLKNTEISDISKKYQDIKMLTINHAINKHPEVVKYLGKNNSQYAKLCVPKKNDIFITDIQLIEFSHYHLNVVFLNQKYALEGYIFKSGALLNWQIQSFYTTEEIKNGTICEICCHIVERGARSGESYQCNKCEADICFDHTYFKKSMFVRRVFFCENCKVQKSVPVREHTTFNKVIRPINWWVSVLVLAFLFIFFGIIWYNISL